MSRLLELPASATGAVVPNASWAGGVSDDGRIIYGASLRPVAEGLVANPLLWSAQNNTRSLTSLAGGSVSFAQAVDINERGQIAVLDAASPSRWYLLTPKP